MLPDQSSVDLTAGSRPPRRWLRPAVLAGFVVSAMLVGWQFHRFVIALSDASSTVPPSRPASVEAWLPISSLMSLTYLVKTGSANRVHPAGLVIFSLTLVLAVAMRRGFCSWVCPIGTLSEYAHKVGRRLLGRNLLMPRWLDVILRALRYLILGFFLYSIIGMSATALRQFIHGPYNRIADVKMYLVFANISWIGLVVMAVLIGLSVVFKNFWCRYLCPYGALLGLCSLISPLAIRRDAERCSDCGRCGKACPNRIPVHKKHRVWSAECTACFSCVSACTKSGTLRMTGWTKRAVSALLYGAITVGLFTLVPQAARAMGYWETGTPIQMYRYFYGKIKQIEHPRTPGVSGSRLNDPASGGKSEAAASRSNNTSAEL